MIKRATWVVILALMIGGIYWTGTTLQQRPHYPYLVIGFPPSDLSITFLERGLPQSQPCQSILASMASTATSTCIHCVVQQANCLDTLTPAQQAALSTDPLDVPSAWVANGVILYRSANHPDIAEHACQKSHEKMSALGMTCQAAHQSRMLPHQPIVHKEALGDVSRHNGLITGWLFLLVGALASAFACALIIRYEHLHSHFSHDHTEGGPQKFHSKPTPRIGGIAVFFGLATVGLLALPMDLGFTMDHYRLLLLASLPAFLGGLTEDITKKVGVLPRLILTMVSGGMGVWLLGAVLHRLDVPGMDSLLIIAPVAMLFTVFAIGGVANAINIIDGFNGLAGGYGVMVLIAMAYVAHQVGDLYLMTTAMVMIGTLLGFLVWNFPFGKIFMGDGGAYLLGFMLAELSVLLVERNPQVSPWFPLALLMYPIFETIYSMYRRRIKHKLHLGHPDDKHLHTLIYKALCRTNKEPQACNPMTALIIWACYPIMGLLAILIFTHTFQLQLLSLTFCVVYVLGYRRLKSWESP